ncbi:DNA methyltransferase [Proteiniclasticum ruminis]|uniref:DNA methyltransferase n=1 Tax=Proteiniclasticum ruminis TaxID=398199 RepID=UPI0028A65823|nr:DNA methyltransferase [Proteiniclasticum ruminis]
MYIELEDKFNVIYPVNSNATYSSIMNYSDDLDKPLQRWYRYKEGYSLELVNQLIKEYNRNPNGTILDPFLGSGTTLIAANKMGLSGVGFEVNPFSYFLSKNKLRNYDIEVIKEYKEKFEAIIEISIQNKSKYPLPKLSIAEEVFDNDIEDYFMTIRNNIELYKYKHSITKELLLLGWLSTIEEVSNYRKAGNGLKRRKYVKPKKMSVQECYEKIRDTYNKIYYDISSTNFDKEIKIYNDTSLMMDKYIKKESISGVIFSPPYANCFDYTEIYKLELWFGEFVREYSDLKSLRSMSLRSHLNGKFEMMSDIKTSGTLELLLSELETKKLWDKRIPSMLRLYFNDMFVILEKVLSILQKDGFCSIVVGNSAYGGIIFPTDLIIAEYAESIGFLVDKIEVDRYIITSSQQYETTKVNKKYLRESVICLVKK